MKVECCEHNITALEKIKECIKNDKTFICTNCTGSGKSLLIKETAKILNRPLLVTRDKRIIDDLDIPQMTYAKFGKENTAQVIKEKYDSIIFDEAHHMAANKCKGTISKVNKKLYGFTATPERMDGINVGSMYFDNTINTLTLFDAWENDVFRKPEYIITTLHKSSDKNKKLIPIAENSINRTFANYISKKNKILVFCANNKDMEYFYDKLKDKFAKYGFECILYSTKHKNESKFNEFRYGNNNKQVLFTIDKLIEGFHIENVDCMLIYRNTKSVRVISQIIGRVCDINGKKRPCIIDFMNNIYIMFDKKTGGKKILKHYTSLMNQMKGKVKYEIDYDELEIDCCKAGVYQYNGVNINLLQFCLKKGINHERFLSFLKRRNTKNITDDTIKQFNNRMIPPVYHYFYDGKEIESMKQFCIEKGIKNAENFACSLMRRYKKAENMYVTDEIINDYLSPKNKVQLLCEKFGIDKCKSYSDWCSSRRLSSLDEKNAKRYIEHHSIYLNRNKCISEACVILKKYGKTWNAFKHFCEREHLDNKQDYSKLDEHLDMFIKNLNTKFKDRIWINNGKTNKFISKFIINHYSNNGWAKGKLKI